MPRELTEIWLQRELPSILKSYNSDDIHNVDEFALFYSALPDKTISFKVEKCTGGMFSKQHLTVIAGANMSGNDKLPLFVIGKQKNPRCFKNIKTLQVKYDAN